MPFGYRFDWSGPVPTGWSAPDPSVFIGDTGVRNYGWTSSSVVGGTVSVLLSNFAQTSVPTLVAITPDAAAPVVDTLPTPQIVSPLGTSTSSITSQIIFGGTDAGSGLASAQLQRSINGGAYSTVMTWTASAPTPGTTLAYNTTLKTGTTYRFRTRLTDRVGNVTGWTYGAAFAPAMLQENGLGVTASGGWTRPAIAGSLGGYVRTTSAAGKTLTIKTTMSQFVVVGRTTVTGGSIRVYVDGVFLGATSSIGSANRQLLALVPFATKKVHTIKLVSVGDGPIYIDAFVVFR